MTTSERKMEAAQRKLDNEFVRSSSNSEDEESEPRAEKKKRKIDVAREAQVAHKNMCDKAMDTMDSVKGLLSKVDSVLDKMKRKKKRKRRRK